MFKNNCRCGATAFYLQYKGNMVGKYCSGCNKWQRWVGKKDLEVYKRNGRIVFKDENPSTPKFTTNTTFKPCTKCGSDKYYLRYKGEMVGKYCEDCDKWSSWIGRKVLEELKYKGYVVNEESYINPNIDVVVEEVKDVVTDEVSGCPKCRGADFYIKERGTNIGKYCSSCNKWLKWVSKTDAKILQSKGMKLQSETYLSHSNGGYNDSFYNSTENNRYVDHSDIFISEYNRLNSVSNSLGTDINTFEGDTITEGINTFKSNNELNINKKDYIDDKKDIGTTKKDIVISNFKYNLDENDANMFLLEKFIANAPRNCYGCRLESKCDMMLVKLCDSIRDVIEFIEDSEVL